MGPAARGLYADGPLSESPDLRHHARVTPPLDAYRTLKALRGSAVARESRRDDRVVAARGVVAALAVATAIAAWEGALAWGWLAVPALGFAVLVVVHDRVLRAKARGERAVAHYDAGLARLEERWAGTGRDGARHAPEHHPYAADLDLFGPGSLFERINTARTGAGEARLAAWLLAAAPPGTIRDRQQAVEELGPRLELREDLALAGETIAAEVHPDRLRGWAEAPASPFPVALRVAAAILGAAGLVTLLTWLGGATSAIPFAILGPVNGAFALALRKRIAAIVHDADRPGTELRVLAEVLARLEAERFDSEPLKRLRAALDSDGIAPSAAIASLARRLDWMEIRRNQLVAPFAAVALWTTQTAMAVEAWRARHGAAVGRWVEACGEIEALAAMGAFAFENPNDPFPELAEDGARFEAEALGHPLIPVARCVFNDVLLDRGRPLLVVSGSNMSGKSTLLRSIGIAAVMAQAGLPVRAARLSLSPLTVGATLRIQDSLREGASRFYAEITRVRDVVALAEGPVPVLFLLDELLAGTNSHDRAAGAEAILRGLVARKAIGLATTHDLALTKLADAMAPRAANVHFEDRLENGRMVFDYRLRPGVVTHSNAIALMRSVGLEV